jgi:hypothetical protein
MVVVFEGPKQEGHEVVRQLAHCVCFAATLCDLNMMLSCLAGIHVQLNAMCSVPLTHRFCVDTRFAYSFQYMA